MFHEGTSYVALLRRFPTSDKSKLRGLNATGFEQHDNTNFARQCGTVAG
jgi:hypothetical protein